MIGGGAEQLVAELGQLAGTDQRAVADQHRRAHLGIAELGAVQIDHEIAQRAFQPGQRAAQQHEPRAGELRRRGKIHLPQPLAYLHMVLDREIEDRRIADPAELDIGRLVRALRDVLGRQIGQPGEQRLERIVEAALGLFERGHALLQRGGLGDQGRGIGARLLGLADLLGNIVAPGLEALKIGLHAAPLGIERDDRPRLGLQPALPHTEIEPVGILPDPTQIEQSKLRGNSGTLAA